VTRTRGTGGHQTSTLGGGHHCRLRFNRTGALMPELAAAQPRRVWAKFPHINTVHRRQGRPPGGPSRIVGRPPREGARISGHGSTLTRVGRARPEATIQSCAAKSSDNPSEGELLPIRPTDLAFGLTPTATLYRRDPFRVRVGAGCSAPRLPWNESAGCGGSPGTPTSRDLQGSGPLKMTAASAPTASPCR